MANPEVGMLGKSPYSSHQEHVHVPPVHVELDHDDHHEHGVHRKGSVSKEDCCKAVLCLIECCDCPETKALLQECCEDILSRC